MSWWTWAAQPKFPGFPSFLCTLTAALISWWDEKISWHPAADLNHYYSKVAIMDAKYMTFFKQLWEALYSTLHLFPENKTYHCLLLCMPLFQSTKAMTFTEWNMLNTNLFHKLILSLQAFRTMFQLIRYCVKTKNRECEENAAVSEWVQSQYSSHSGTMPYS